jgi:hypothetical protein
MDTDEHERGKQPEVDEIARGGDRFSRKDVLKVRPEWVE